MGDPFKGQTNILQDFWIQTDKLAMANQPDILVVNKQHKKPAVIAVPI